MSIVITTFTKVIKAHTIAPKVVPSFIVQLANYCNSKRKASYCTYSASGKTAVSTLEALNGKLNTNSFLPSLNSSEENTNLCSTFWQATALRTPHDPLRQYGISHVDS